MTMIAQYPTKKAFKEAVAADPSKVLITDPALMPEWRQFGCEQFTLDRVQVTQHFTVTNHPKRSWFAEVRCTGDGQYKVL